MEFCYQLQKYIIRRIPQPESGKVHKAFFLVADSHVRTVDVCHEFGTRGGMGILH